MCHRIVIPQACIVLTYRTSTTRYRQHIWWTFRLQRLLALLIHTI